MNDSAKAGRAIVSFFIPPVGLITWAINKEVKPNASKTYLIIAGVSFGLYYLSYLLTPKTEKNEY